MNADDFTLLPPQRLAIAYAPQHLRAAMGLLLRFDDRIAGVVGRSNEPIFAQMKIAWWHDVISKPADLRPKGEPILAELAWLGDADQADRVTEAMPILLDAWGILVAHEEWTPDILQAFATARSKAVFGSYADWVDADEPKALGQRWAIDDLVARFGKEFGGIQDEPSCRFDRKLRPMTILALSARPDVSGARVVWHALTGR